MRPEVRQTPTTKAALIGRSEAAQTIRRFAEKTAPTSHTLLIRGEMGTGKDLLALKIHEMGRQGRPWIRVDCGALAPSLSETELFGHTKGAFTDAKGDKQGLVLAAGTGTLFFNELANMSLDTQAKFLGILEGGTVRQVGALRETPIEARMIGATNANLEKLVEEGKFRGDLFHRLNLIPFEIPPLRARAEDVPDLVEHFMAMEGVQKTFADSTIALMMGYPWPGNIRELKDAVVRAVFLAEGDEVLPEHVAPYMKGVGDAFAVPTYLVVQRRYFQDVLRRTRGNITVAARLADVSPRVMRYKIEKLQLMSFVAEVQEGVDN